MYNAGAFALFQDLMHLFGGKAPRDNTQTEVVRDPAAGRQCRHRALLRASSLGACFQRDGLPQGRQSSHRQPDYETPAATVQCSRHTKWPSAWPIAQR